MTSAHTIQYTIRDKHNHEVGKHSWNFYCKTRWHELNKFKPASEFTIQAWGYDESDDYWEDEPMSLEEFLSKRTTS